MREKSRKRELGEVPEQGEAPKQPQSRLEVLDKGKTKGKLIEAQSQPTLGHLFWASPSSFSFTRDGEGRVQSGLLWTCSGPLLSLFLLLSLLWGSFSGTSPESLLVVWPPPGSSGWLWPPPSSLCLLLRVIRKKSDSGASLELPSGHLPPLSSLGSSGWLWPSPSSLCLLCQ